MHRSSSKVKRFGATRFIWTLLALRRAKKHSRRLLSLSNFLPIQDATLNRQTLSKTDACQIPTDKLRQKHQTLHRYTSNARQIRICLTLIAAIFDHLYVYTRLRFNTPLISHLEKRKINKHGTIPEILVTRK